MAVNCSAIFVRKRRAKPQTASYLRSSSIRIDARSQPKMLRIASRAASWISWSYSARKRRSVKVYRAVSVIDSRCSMRVCSGRLRFRLRSFNRYRSLIGRNPEQRLLGFGWKIRPPAERDDAGAQDPCRWAHTLPAGDLDCRRQARTLSSADTAPERVRGRSAVRLTFDGNARLRKRDREGKRRRIPHQGCSPQVVRCCRQSGWHRL